MSCVGNTNPYVMKDDSPVLRHSIVAFVDILGYKELSREKSSSLRFLVEIREAFRNAFRSLDPHTDEPPDSQRCWMAKTFTDNIVVGFPITFDDGAYEFFMVLSHLAELQLQMAVSGFFVRGAVSVGDIYMDEQIVFGPALIEAHDAEEKRARDPRIVLASSARATQYIQLSMDMAQKESYQHHDVILQDVDGQLFLNYLQGVVEFEHDMLYPYTEYLEKHRDHLLERLGRFAVDPRVWSKYYWCATYHNYFCSGRAELEEYMINMLSITPQPRRIMDV